MTERNADMSAAPMVVSDDKHVWCEGLTKRERFAMAAMQGILSSPYYSDFCDQPDNYEKPKAAAEAAVKHADALLEELEKRYD